ncbi:MAG TPA: xanthine dehydrogenase family protein molybdopterin-binding subunit [Steroidobacteraceae bacterium]|nr:xanthine dehydrogenase family protein molybdopterin-binding subunit [Steroidobacteraceae bacterium]
MISSEQPPAVDSERRAFLRGAAHLGGGLVLAFALPGFIARARAVSAPHAQLNAWLRIGPDDSITILVDRSEMGQGVYTALPTLLAEELELNPSRVRIAAAPVGPAYVNAQNGGQITGTSNSVPEAWEKLRKAGAQARTMLIAAAAQRWHVDPSACRAIDGRIVSAQGRSASYGQLADAAARMPVPKDVPLKDPAHFRLIGKPLPRLDTPSKVDGSAQFGLDVRLPGMLYAVIALSPTLGGKVASLDTAAALAMPGVRRVLPTPSGVVVVADHFWQARKAREALRIDWLAGPNADLDTAAIRSLLEHAAASPGASALRSDDVAAALKGGNASQALQKAAKTLSAVYEVPLLAHATMEPMNCTADVKAQACDVYVGTQAQQLTQIAAAAAAGLKPEQVNVHTTLLGGGFGRRLETDFVPAAVQASRAVGAPVKLIWTREDDMTHDLFRPPAREEVAAGLDESGRLVAWSLHIVSPSITARFDPTNKDPFDSVIEYVQNFPYAVANFDLRFTRQEIGIDVGYWRSVSHTPNCFAIESSLDELAVAASKNPLDFRLQLLAGKPRHLRVLNTVAERSGWGHAPSGRYQGIAFMEGYASLIAQVADISIEQGRLIVHRITCVVDCGQTVNPRIVESQIQSGIIYGLSAALWGRITLRNGRVQQSNFNSSRVLRLNETPEIDVHIIPSDAPPGGIGEAAVPQVAPALCNAIFAATSRRLRSLPISAHRLA